MKTKPYGVRFETEQLENLECATGIKTPQKAVNFLFDFWVTNRNVNFEVLRRLENLQIIVGTPFVEKIEITESKVPKSKSKEWDKYDAPKIDIGHSDESPQMENKPQEGEKTNFEGVTIFRIEEYTKYPVSSKPKTATEQISWASTKKREDAKIKAEYDEYKNNLK